MQQPDIKELISYTPETYFSDEELELIRAHFNGPSGRKLMKVVRKALLPTISDPDLPVEELGKDMFMSAVDFRQMQAEETKAVAMGLQLTAKLIAGAIMNLQTLANVAPDDEKTKAAIAAKNSAK